MWKNLIICTQYLKQNHCRKQITSQSTNYVATKKGFHFRKKEKKEISAGPHVLEDVNSLDKWEKFRSIICVYWA